MRTFSVVLALLCAQLSAQHQAVSKVAFTDSKHAIRAFSASGEVTLSADLRQLDIHYPSGKDERGYLSVVYHPATGYFLWRYNPLRRPGDLASILDVLESGMGGIYAGSTGLVEFYMPGQLYVKEHIKRADSLDAAEDAAIDEIQRGLVRFEGTGFADSREVPVARGIDRQFACELVDGLPRVNCGFAAKSIVSISLQGDNWRVVVRNRWDQEIILDSKFNLVSTQRLPEPQKE